MSFRTNIVYDRQCGYKIWRANYSHLSANNRRSDTYNDKGATVPRLPQLACFKHSRSSKVIDKKRICDFLLVRHSNPGPILHRFLHLYSTSILRCSCWTRSLMLGVNVSTQLKLFDREIIFEVFQPMWKSYLNVTDGRTDRRTDDLYCVITALCVISRGKNLLPTINISVSRSLFQVFLIFLFLCLFVVVPGKQCRYNFFSEFTSHLTLATWESLSVR